MKLSVLQIKTEFRQSSKGFTLLEVLIAILTMGLSVAGILNLFNWGMQKYAQLNGDRSYRVALTSIRREIRTMVSTANFDCLNKAELAGRIAFQEKLGIAEFFAKQYSQESMFVHVRLFQDRNKNEKPDENELFPPVLLSFTVRTQQ